MRDTEDTLEHYSKIIDSMVTVIESIENPILINSCSQHEGPKSYTNLEVGPL